MVVSQQCGTLKARPDKNERKELGSSECGAAMEILEQMRETAQIKQIKPDKEPLDEFISAPALVSGRCPTQCHWDVDVQAFITLMSYPVIS